MFPETDDKHTVQAFDADLRALDLKIISMAGRDGQQISQAVEALVSRDAELANRVIAADDEIDGMQREIEHEATAILARRQPMAVDLRNTIAALRIANDLERIGDLAENIAMRTVLLPNSFPFEEPILQLKHMAGLVLEQLTGVIESYERRDLLQALDVWKKDKELDALNNSLFRELLTHMMENPSGITLCTHLLFCAKNIERMGDHITNIAETIHYAVKGEPPPGERPKADITSKRLSAQPAAREA